jgi:hypothetical protein
MPDKVGSTHSTSGDAAHKPISTTLRRRLYPTLIRSLYWWVA